MKNPWENDPEVTPTNDTPWENDPIVEQPSVGNKISRVVTGLEETPVGVGQLAAHGIKKLSDWTGLAPETAKSLTDTMDQKAKELEETHQKQRQEAGLAPSDIDWYNTVGSIAPSFIPGMGASRLARAVPAIERAVSGTSLAAKAGEAAIQGLGVGASQPVTNSDNYWTQKGIQTGIGGIGGATIPAIAKVAGNVISPVLSKSAQMMKEAGVRVPVNPLGKTIGEYTKDFPLAGLVPQHASENALQDFERGTANRVLSPINETIPTSHPVGPELIDSTRDKISNVYNSVHPNIQLGMDNQLGTELQNIQQRAIASGLPSSQLDSLDRIISNQIGGKLMNGADGKTIQSMTSELGNAINGYARDPSFDNRNLGGFIGEAREALTDAINRQNSPDLTQNLRNANKAYSLYKTMERAAGTIGGGPGRFSPSQLLRAGNAGTTAFRKATGTGNLQDWAQAGVEQLGNKVPNSGTPQRLLGQALFHSLGSAATHGAGYGILGPSALVPAAGIATTYSQPVQWALRGITRHRPSWAPGVAGSVERTIAQAASPIAAIASHQQ